MGANQAGTRYDIIIEGELHSAWAAWFDGLELQSIPGGLVRISGCLPDQPALHGILERIRDLNLNLVSVQRQAD